MPNFLKFRFQMVQYSDGRSMGYVLCTTPTIQIFDLYIRKQDGIHLSIIQMVGLSSIQMTFQNQTFWHPTSFRPFKYQTSLVFRSSVYDVLLFSIFNTKLGIQIPNAQKLITSKKWTFTVVE